MLSVRTPNVRSASSKRWRITRIKAKAVELGTVEAPDAESAIKCAIEQYGITDREQQKRLAAYRVS